MEAKFVARGGARRVACASARAAPAVSGTRRRFRQQGRFRSERLRRGVVVSTKQQDEEAVETPETTIKKFGLEVGLFKTLTDKTKSDGRKKADAKTLLSKYGPAYLLTSISFAIVSFALCYFLVSVGIDVPALLSKIGLNATTTSENVGKFAIAYAAHKAASPIRFPPTVALTPVVAKLIGKKGSNEEEEEEGKEESV